MAAVFSPAEFLMSRLRLASKFVVFALILIIPMAYVTWSFRNAKEFNVRIGVKEKHGDLYMVPATKLFATEVQARATVVRGQDVSGLKQQLDQQVAALEPIVKKYGAEYTNDKTWLAAKDALTQAENATGTPESIFEGWNAATAALLTDITQVSGGSTLILDPQLDTYNLMDANTNRAMLAMDFGNQSTDLATLLLAKKVAHPDETRIQIAKDSDHAAAALATIDGEYDGAYAVTKWKGLKDKIQPSREKLDASVGSLTTALDQIALSGQSTANMGRLGSAVTSDASDVMAAG